MDIPVDLRTTFYNSHNNPDGVLGSKATGEPSVLFGVGVLFAIRQALNAARRDRGETVGWYPLGEIERKRKSYSSAVELNIIIFFSDGPATAEKIQAASGVTSDAFVI